MASTISSNPLPNGSGVFTSVPDLFFILEFVCGGLVWILVASTKVLAANPQAWVMFVSLFCFIVTTLLFFIFIGGGNKGSIWPTLDVAYHALAALFYLSASVLQAHVTIQYGLLTASLGSKIYHENVAAVVMSFVATLLYTVHTVFSAIRWKSYCT